MIDSRRWIERVLSGHLRESGLTPLPMFIDGDMAHVTSREISPPYNIPHGGASYSNYSGWVRWDGLDGNGEYRIEKGLLK